MKDYGVAPLVLHTELIHVNRHVVDVGHRVVNALEVGKTGEDTAGGQLHGLLKGLGEGRGENFGGLVPNGLGDLVVPGIGRG